MNDNGDRSRWGQATKCAEPRTLTNSQLESAPQPFHPRAVKIISVHSLRHINTPSSLPCPPRTTSFPRTCDLSPSWRITPLSSPWVFSLTVPLLLPPPNPTSFTSFASRLSRLGRFPNPLLRCMLPHPQTLSSLLPSSPTRLPPTPPTRKRQQSFVHSFLSTSPRTKTSLLASFCLRLTREFYQQFQQTLLCKWSTRCIVLLLVSPYSQTTAYDILIMASFCSPVSPHTALFS